MKKITQTEIDALTKKLKGEIAEYSNVKTTPERRDELRAHLRDENERINYLQKWLDGGCKMAENGEALIGHGDGFEITVKL